MEPAVCGFRNVGNTCFANSSMQCLIHSPPLRDRLLQRDTAGLALKRGSTLAKLQSLADKYFDGRNAGRSINPHAFLSHVLKKARHLRLGRQEDGHEFLRHLVDAVHESEKLPEGELSLAQQVWGFFLESCVRCRKCGHRSITRDAAMDLSLDISERAARTLGGALNAFFAEEELDRENKVDCERCKRKRLSAKRFAMGSLPQVLVCHLKRFDAMGRKIGRPVDYPEVIDIGAHLTDAQVSRMRAREAGSSAGARRPTARYRLFGVVVHDGSSQFGHYYSYVRPGVGSGGGGGGGGGWWLLNDSSCSRARLESALAQQAYILFYAQERASSAHTTPRVHARLLKAGKNEPEEPAPEHESVGAPAPRARLGGGHHHLNGRVRAHPVRDLRGRELRAPVEVAGPGSFDLEAGWGKGPDGDAGWGHDDEALALEYEDGYDDTAGRGRGGRAASGKVGVADADRERAPGSRPHRAASRRVSAHFEVRGGSQQRKRQPACCRSTLPGSHILQVAALALVVAAGVVASLVGAGVVRLPSL